MKKYIVREGDTLWQISKVTGVRLNLLLAANPQVRDPNRLEPGSVVSIPELGKDTGTGSANGGPVADSTPSPHGAPYFGFVWPHVVKYGETWDSVANLYSVSVDGLRRMNPHHGGPLQPDEVIYVPGTAGQVPGAPGAGQGHIDPATGQPTSIGPHGAGSFSGWPQTSPTGISQVPGPGWPEATYVPGALQGANTVSGYPQAMAPSADELGPHTHSPLRVGWYDSMMLPPYPVYVPAEPDRDGWGVPYDAYRADGQGDAALWGESSAWESDWNDPLEQPHLDPEARLNPQSTDHRSHEDGSAQRSTDPRGAAADGPAGSAQPEVWHWPDAFGGGGSHTSRGSNPTHPPGDAGAP